MAEQRRVERLDQPREPRAVKLPRFDPEAFGRWSEGIARSMGTANFIVYMTAVIGIWFGWNTLAPPSLRFDPYTFTFLTLVLSLQASYAAPLILLAQNRQADRDRLAMEEDRRRATMQKADTEYLSREIAALRIAMGEMATRTSSAASWPGSRRSWTRRASAGSGSNDGSRRGPRPGRRTRRGWTSLGTRWTATSRATAGPRPRAARRAEPPGNT